MDKTNPEEDKKPAPSEKSNEAAPAAKAAPEKAAAPKPAAAKPPVKPPAKPAPKPKDPLIDNGDGTITDPNSGFMWKRDDAWLDMHKFYTWADHKEYVDKVNGESFAGHTDWRLPSKAEALTLFDKTKENIDKNGTTFPIDPIFPIGCVSNTWISECTEEKIVRFDFKIGNDMPYPPSEVWASMRLVRKAESALKDSGSEAEGKEEAKKEGA